MKTKIKLKNTQTLYCEGLNGRPDTSITLRAGEEVDYEREECKGWTLHRIWKKVKLDTYYLTRYDHHLPYAYANSTSTAYCPGTLYSGRLLSGDRVLVDGKYEGMLIGKVKSNEISSTQMWRVLHDEDGPLGAVHSYSLVVQVLPKN